MQDVLGIDARRIDDSTRMDRLGVWDSATHVNLCLCLEEEFNVTLSVSEIEAMTSYRDILKVLRGRL
jgi:acyl carrier protein